MLSAASCLCQTAYEAGCGGCACLSENEVFSLKSGDALLEDGTLLLVLLRPSLCAGSGERIRRGMRAIGEGGFLATGR